jgi:hypothetical protein
MMRRLMAALDFLLIALQEWLLLLLILLFLADAGAEHADPERDSAVEPGGE